MSKLAAVLAKIPSRPLYNLMPGGSGVTSFRFFDDSIDTKSWVGETVKGVGGLAGGLGAESFKLLLAGQVWYQTQDIGLAAAFYAYGSVGITLAGEAAHFFNSIDKMPEIHMNTEPDHYVPC